MSPEVFSLDPVHEQDGLRYGAGDLTILAVAQRTRWSVTVSRGEMVLGIDVLNLADAKQRLHFVRSLRGLEGEEATSLDRFLIALALRVAGHWQVYLEWLQRGAGVEQADNAALAEEEAAEVVAARVASLEVTVLSLLDDPALLFRIGQAIAAQGVVGEQANALLLYVAISSQHGATSISVYVKGDSSGGKSWLVARVLLLFPDDAHIDLTSMSERALLYDQRSYSHKTIVIYEMHGQGSEFSTYLIRSLISEGRLSHLTVEKTDAGMAGKQIVKEGPTNFITTTTAPEGHAENETRVLTILVDDSPDTTRKVIAMQGNVAAGVFAFPDPGAWQAVQEWLALAGVHEAIVPFAPALAERMPDKPLRLRRDFPRLLLLIQAVAVLYQRQRAPTPDGRVVATLADYAMACQLVAESYARAQRGLTEKTIELVEALRAVLDEKMLKTADDTVCASYTDLVKQTGRPKSYVWRWLKPALELGVVDNLESEKGRAALLRMGKYELGDVRALPSMQALADAMGEECRWVDPLTGQEHEVRPGEPEATETLQRSDAGGRHENGEPLQCFSVSVDEPAPVFSPVIGQAEPEMSTSPAAAGPSFGEV